MYNTNRILIVVLILLVLAIGLAGGYIIQSNSMNNNSLTVNQTNQSINNTNNTTTESTSGGESSSSDESNNYETGELTEDEAINIALSAVGHINQKYYVKTAYSVGGPHKWHVDFYNSKTNQHIVGVSINAATGEVRAIYTI